MAGPIGKPAEPGGFGRSDLVFAARPIRKRRQIARPKSSNTLLVKSTQITPDGPNQTPIPPNKAMSPLPIAEESDAEDLWRRPDRLAH